MRGVNAKLVLICCLSAFLLILTACDQKPENPVSRYGDSLIKSYQGAQNAAEQANLDAIQKAISAYRAANEGFPKNLQDIENLIGGSIDLTKYEYDPATGKVTPKPKQ
jgi:hypothetical protein